MRQRISVGSILASLLALCVLGVRPSLAQTTTLTNASDIATTTGSVQLANAISLSFPTNPASTNTIVVMVAYTNAANAGTLAVSGLTATWTTGYAPAFTSGLGIAFFYGTNPSGSQSAVVITAAQPDNLVVVAQAWQNLSVTEDPGTRVLNAGQNQSPTVTVNTSNANDVIFNVVGFLGTALPSPPSTGFLDIGLVPTGQYPPNVTGGLGIVDTAGIYTNTFSTSASVTWVSAAVALETAPGDSNVTFTATPLTDFSSGELYATFFPGMLYNDSNTPDAGHENDGLTAASAIVPLDRDGSPAVDGKIGWVGIGGSNLTADLCTSNFITSRNAAQCNPDTFFDQANKLANINPSLVLADCAATGLFASNWLNLGSGGWTGCLGTRLPAYGITPAQVEVVAINDDDGLTTAPTLDQLASSDNGLCPTVPTQGVDPDACVYEANLAELVRLLRVEFPNLKQIFLQPRTYCGYGSAEPLCYENGFAIKWLIQAQVDGVEGTPNLAGSNDALAAPVSYASSAWMAWGPYLWSAGAIPDAQSSLPNSGQSWPPNDFQYDGSSPSQCQYYGVNCGSEHDADLMMAFYTTSPYTAPWFVTTPSTTYKLTVSPASINFGKRDIGLTGETSKARTITIRNPGGSKRPTITIGTPTTTGDIYGNYQITGGTCTTGLELAPGKSCTITVVYTPLGPATSFGSLTLANNGSGLATVALKGTGTIAEVTVSPRTLAFAKTSVGTTAKAKTVTLKNSNDVPLTLAPFILGGANGGDFAQTSLCPVILKAQKTCTISVTFTPAATGSSKADIAVTASLDSTSINLSGSGK